MLMIHIGGFKSLFVAHFIVQSRNFRSCCLFWQRKVWRDCFPDIHGFNTIFVWFTYPKPSKISMNRWYEFQCYAESSPNHGTLNPQPQTFLVDWPQWIATLKRSNEHVSQGSVDQHLQLGVVGGCKLDGTNPSAIAVIAPCKIPQARASWTNKGRKTYIWLEGVWSGRCGQIYPSLLSKPRTTTSRL